MEARAGIEPACKDLQSSASPLRHRAIRVEECAPSNRSRGAQWVLRSLSQIARPIAQEGVAGWRGPWWNSGGSRRFLSGGCSAVDALACRIPLAEGA